MPACAAAPTRNVAMTIAACIVRYGVCGPARSREELARTVVRLTENTVAARAYFSHHALYFFQSIFRQFFKDVVMVRVHGLSHKSSAFGLQYSVRTSLPLHGSTAHKVNHEIGNQSARCASEIWHLLVGVHGIGFILNPADTNEE